MCHLFINDKDSLAMLAKLYEMQYHYCVMQNFMLFMIKEQLNDYSMSMIECIGHVNNNYKLKINSITIQCNSPINVIE